MAARCLWLLALFIIGATLVGVGQSHEEPTFSQCRVHIEAAIKGITPGEGEAAEPTTTTASTTLAEEPTVVEEEAPVEPIEPPAPEEEAPASVEEEPQAEEQQPEPAHEEQGDGDDDGDQAEEPVEAADEPDEAANEEDDDDHADEDDDKEAADQPEHDDDQSGEEHEAAEAEAEAPQPAEEVEQPPAPEEEEAPATPEPEAVEEPLALPAEEDAAAPEPAQIEEPPAAAEEAPVTTEEPAAPAPEAEEPAPAVEEENPAEGIIEEEPAERRSRDHIAKILRLGEDAETDMMRESIVLSILKDVKKVVESSVRSLENIFKYGDVSNRNFGDPEIFSKPLVLFLGPWSGGKSSIINYLLGTEFTQNALKTGAEPSATFFQILMYGDTEEKLDGTQLAADWTFSGLQKFGQAFIDRLRGRRLPNKILEKVNIVEVPGILEVRKQVDRPYPFNDVVQWFIDRADIIFVVYDPTKLDTGLEHEALFDQLKGRQTQVRVLLNKADSVTQEELLLIQNNLVWNLSPLMASPLPPTLYAGSFWSVPYKPDAPVRLLRSHEENWLQDLRDTMDSVVENTIAEARRHAVRVRNHAKMVDCYLTTFFNQKGYFGNKKAVADDIIENPHNYHIFEGLSTLNNISRYDLPDSDVYKDFFRLHPLYDFKQLAATCTFFRGCPLDKLDTAIAYELPELVGKYKKRLQAIAAGQTKKAGH